MRLVTVILVGVLLMQLASQTKAETGESITNGKKAVAVVVGEIGPTVMEMGTALCIEPSGYFICGPQTVIPDPEGKVKLIVNLGETNQSRISARILRREPLSGMTLVKTIDSGPYTALELSDSTKVTAGQKLIMIRYALGADRKPQIGGGHLLVETHKVESLGMAPSGVSGITLTRSAGPNRVFIDNPECRVSQGGVLMDETGRVAGILSGRNSDGSFRPAVSAQWLTKMLSSPEITIPWVSVPFDQRHKELPISIGVTQLIPSSLEYNVEVVLAPEKGGGRRYVATSVAKGVYQARVIPRVANENVLVDDVACQVIVKHKGQVLVETLGTIFFEAGSKLPLASKEIKAPDLYSAKTTVRLPGLVNGVARGGGGRYLVLRFEKLPQLAVFDVNELRLVGTLPLPSADVLFTASRDKILVYVPAQGVWQRWNLRTLERELVVAGDGSNILAVAAGCEAVDRFMVVTSPAGPSLWSIDGLSRLQTQTTQSEYRWPWERGSSIRLSASDDGSAYAWWTTGQSPQGVGLLQPVGRTIYHTYRHETVLDLIPSNEGRLLYAGDIVYDAHLRPQEQTSLAQMLCLPSTDPAFAVGAKIQSNSIPSGVINNFTLSIFTPLDQQVVLALPPLDEISSSPFASSILNGPLSVTNQIHLIPQAQILVTIAETRDRLIVRKLDLLAEIAKNTSDYLCVTSRSERVVRRGANYVYPMVVLSKRGGIRYNMVTAPTGMRVSAEGMVTWAVPKEAPVGETEVVVLVKDASGQEKRHAFTLTVR